MSRRIHHPLSFVGIIAVLAIVVPISSVSGEAARRVRLHCAAHFPKLIKDGFPEPRLVFSRHGVLDISLRASYHTLRLNHQTVNTMEYDNSIPGPTLVACPGDRIVVHLENELSVPTNLHVHGLHVSPNGNADNVFVRIDPHQRHTYSYRIPLDQDPGAFWYHPHLHMFVYDQINEGLAGPIIIQGGLDNRMSNIPQRLIFVQGGKPGGQGFPRGQGCHLPGFGLPQPPGCPPTSGPRLPAGSLDGPGPLLVNGALQPTIKIRPGQIERWRIFNATAARFLDLNLRGQNLDVLAKDGETLRWMRPTNDLLIGPGSRREVLVRGGPPGRYGLAAVPFRQCFASCPDPIGGVPNSGLKAPKVTLLTVVSSGRRVRDRMPSHALPGNGLPDLRRFHVDRRRSLVFARARMTFGPPQYPLNGMVFNPDRVDMTMKLNSVEEWTLTNPSTSESDEWHNFHIHQNPFQVISVNGARLKYVDYEDTVSLPPGSTVVIRMRPIDFTGKFVFHCHHTFHEDQGMMGVVQVVRQLTGSQSRASTSSAGSMIAIGSSAYGSSQTPRVAIASAMTLFCDPLKHPCRRPPCGHR